jgi:hypothetical protein
MILKQGGTLLEITVPLGQLHEKIGPLRLLLAEI